MFQSTHPRGVRPSLGQSSVRPSNRFNPRTRVGCDRSGTRRTGGCSWFQSTHPRGVRHDLGRGLLHLGGFNPRTRVGCDRNPASSRASPSSFNPRTRVGCDRFMDLGDWMTDLFQSTHPRGVRPGLAAAFSSPCRFQSTHPRGVRRHILCRYFHQSHQFQSTHPRGVRRRLSDKWVTGLMVSIHAPAWGATSRCSASSTASACFNPRTRVGCDGRVIWAWSDVRGFQSTHPRGVRQKQTVAFFEAVQFQSTHPRGVRRPRQQAPAKRKLFQSTHPRGVRHKRRVWTHRLMLVSIHAPAWGATSVWPSP